MSYSQDYLHTPACPHSTRVTPDEINKYKLLSLARAQKRIFHWPKPVKAVLKEGHGEGVWKFS